MFIIKKQFGFSLIEVMIVMLVVSIITVNLAKLTKDQAAISYRRTANDDMNAVITQIGTILADPTKCTAFLGGLTLSPIQSTPELNPALNPTPTLPVLTNIDGKFSAPNQIYTNIVYDDTIPKLGNNRVAIHSFQVGSFSNNLTDPTKNTAVLVVNFFRKTARPWIAGQSTWQGKKINLAVSTTPGGQVISCVALGYFNPDFPTPATTATPNIANGIKFCPSGTTMVGSIGQRGTFCIQNQHSLMSGKFLDAINNCFTSTDAIFGNGNAHLCTLQEWTKACYLQTSTTALNPLPYPGNPAGLQFDNTQWEWISTPPVTTVTTASASNAVEIGKKISNFDQCITTNRIDPVQVPPALQLAFNNANSALGQQQTILNGFYNSYHSALSDFKNACQACKNSINSINASSCYNSSNTGNTDADWTIQTANCGTTTCYNGCYQKTAICGMCKPGKGSAPNCTGGNSNCLTFNTDNGTGQIPQAMVITFYALYMNDWSSPINGVTYPDYSTTNGGYSGIRNTSTITTQQGAQPQISDPLSESGGTPADNFQGGNYGASGAYGAYLYAQFVFSFYQNTWNQANAALAAAQPTAYYRCCYR